MFKKWPRRDHADPAHRQVNHCGEKSNRCTKKSFNTAPRSVSPQSTLNKLHPHAPRTLTNKNGVYVPAIMQ